MIVDYLEYKKRLENIKNEELLSVNKRNQLSIELKKTEQDIFFLKGRIEELTEILAKEVAGSSIADVKSGNKPAQEVKF